MQDAGCKSSRGPQMGTCERYGPFDIMAAEAGSKMTIRKRSLVIAILFAIASVLYGAARHYSPSLVLFVVEQSLLQKAPSGIDPASVHERFHACVAAAHDQNSQMQRLLQISEYLEKVQRLSLEQMDQLLTPDTAVKPVSSRSSAATDHHG
jgi:hypothetical protein